MPITEPTIGQTNWGTTLNTALTQLDTIGASNGYHTQTLAAGGAVTIDASTGRFQNILLQANATSSSVTNASVGQLLTVQWTQDATGSRTYVWPTNFKFAGGAAPTASTLANYSDSVTVEYDGTNWREVSRSAAVH